MSIKPMTTPMTISLDEIIWNWWTDEGGGLMLFNGKENYAPHAARLLREVVELCIASGMSHKDVITTVGSELTRHYEKDVSVVQIKEELSDVYILLSILRHLTKHDSMDVFDKMKVNWKREWEPDKDGVLWRPKTTE